MDLKVVAKVIREVAKMVVMGLKVVARVIRVVDMHLKVVARVMRVVLRWLSW